MTLCHWSVVHWIRTVDTGGWSSSALEPSATFNDPTAGKYFHLNKPYPLSQRPEHTA